MDTPGPDGAAEKTGIAFWMERVLRECERAAQDFAPEAVHDLRVALRRCRSIAAGFIRFDSDPGWADMRKEATRLFKKLGELRDSQVMAAWAGSASAPGDDAAALLLAFLASRETGLKQAAAEALDRFDRRKWSSWSERLPGRASLVRTDSLAFRHLALELWDKAHRLHRQALRNRSFVGFHRLRIGLKKYRYALENFLPSLHEEWGPALRELQDQLGEIHDLHVLLQTAISIGAFPDGETRGRWRSWVAREIDDRLALYRRRMTGRTSLWGVWRESLPEGRKLELAVLERLKTWASFRDPDCARSRRVVRLALRLYDVVARLDLVANSSCERARDILRAAALLHAVGDRGRAKKGRKQSYRLIRNLESPIGWTPDDFATLALVVRLHSGSLPGRSRKVMRGLSPDRQRPVALLSGILRLAVSLASI